MHLTTSAADFSLEETLVVKEEETYDAGVLEKVGAEVVKLLKEPPSFFGISRAKNYLFVLYWRYTTHHGTTSKNHESFGF